MSRVARSSLCVVMLVVLLAAPLGACGPEPTPTLAPSATPIPPTKTPVPPSATPMPTNTPTPSPTPTPTYTSTPEPIPTPATPPTPVPTPEVAMATYTSAQYPFAVQYPAECSQQPSDETVTAQYGGNSAGIAIAEEDLEAEGLGGTTLQEYADLVLFVLSASLEDFELISRHEGLNAQGFPVQVLVFSGGPGGVLKGSRLVYVHENRVAFNATYWSSPEPPVKRAA